MARVQWVEAYRLPSSVLVRVGGTDGPVGWGEAGRPGGSRSSGSAGDGASGGGLERCWADIEERLGPALAGLDWDLPEEPIALDEHAGPVGHAAAAAVDIARWDLWCRQRDTPLAHALGGTRTSVMAGSRVVAEPVLESLLTHVNRCVGAGFTRVTVPVRPGWDVEPVRAIRRAFPALAIVADANGSYAEDPGHLTALVALDAYGLVAIERPFPPGDLTAHARLQQAVATPVALEPAELAALDEAIAIGAGRAVALRVSRLGGLTAARGAHDRALAAGWDAWCRADPGAGVEAAAAVAIASLPGCGLPSDIPDGGLAISPPVRPHAGVVAVPLTQPGLGHTMDVEAIANLATARLRIPA